MVMQADGSIPRPRVLQCNASIPLGMRLECCNAWGGCWIMQRTGGLGYVPVNTVDPSLFIQINKLQSCLMSLNVNVFAAYSFVFRVTAAALPTARHTATCSSFRTRRHFLFASSLSFAPSSLSLSA